MKKFLTLLVFVAGFLGTQAQAPQAVCYQAVATDAGGVELGSANIGVRATILQGGMDGTEIWQEVHSPTTDDFGLFNLDIGTGTRTGGTALEFRDIDWGTGPFFLRVEMDAAGGMDYVFMGANQILSVPYALHSERSNSSATADTASFANVANSAFSSDTALYAQTSNFSLNADTALYVTNSFNSITSDTATVALVALNDFDTDPNNELQDLLYDPTTNELALSNASGASVTLDVTDADADPMNEIQELTFEDNVLTLSNPQGDDTSVDLDLQGFGAPGASADFPLGILGDYVVLLSGTYIVPDSKEFFVTAGPPSVKFRTPDGNITPHPTTPNMPIFGPEAEIVDCMCTGFLVDASSIVEAEVIEISSLTDVYTVPAGKILFIKSGLENSNTSYLKINGVDLEFLRPNFTRGTRIMSFPEGTTIALPSTSGITQLIMTGYLIDSDL